jgi:anhydro-N-acetylmuramic acid kinase
MSRSRPHTALVLGLMSGTSADGVDAALVRITENISARFPSARLEGFASHRYPKALREEILRVAEGKAASAGEISRLNFRVGEEFARAAMNACRRLRVRPQRIALVGSHGQTIFHGGAPDQFLGARVASTLQIGEPAVIAARTGITTIADFRPADIAAGGQGAPLVPFVDYFLYRDTRRARIALNIGGIANITVIPAGAALDDVAAFDTGPGNMVIDALVRRATRGKQQFDRNASIASRGTLLPKLLDSLLAGEYFRRPPPKTAGREQFGEEYVRRLLAHPAARRARNADLIRTATVLTALSIVDAIHRWVPRSPGTAELIVSGGGARNPLLVGQIAAALGGIRVISSGDLGLPEHAKEAFAFAILAWETFHHRPANVPSATGAAGPAILGKICYAPPRS